MFRGILSTIYIDLKPGFSIKKIENILKNFFLKKDLLKILKKNSFLSPNNVINSNNCLISICKTKDRKKIIILSVIDNLIKGGAGQAIQNLNTKFSFKTTEGFK